jgi:hypothetical protein
MPVELDVKIFDRLYPFGLHDRGAVDEVLGLDQHAVATGRMAGKEVALETA